MYAARKFYVQNWDFTPKEERFSVKVTRGGQPLKALDCDRISAVEEEVMYWRKANHIHAWFVDNVQGGNDDCGSYRVSDDKLRELNAVCRKVLDASKLVGGTVHAGTRWTPGSSGPVELREPGRVIEDPSVAKHLLPTREGFFFGSTGYDDSYLGDVQATYDWTTRMLSDLQVSPDAGRIYYSSSW